MVFGDLRGTPFVRAIHKRIATALIAVGSQRHQGSPHRGRQKSADYRSDDANAE